ncbi:hypothetical protein GMST_05700 [Geomonas silvestris]|uniref:Uncharacterized protein n=1 Tax=Geomonas silvestris TaxID=2740184 RepID=A0A6V8ME35_9BACT|nr:hypothetical protein GMST_05700 [Geomonas silvestris]
MAAKAAAVRHNLTGADAARQGGKAKGEGLHYDGAQPETARGTGAAGSGVPCRLSATRGPEPGGA